MKSFALLLALVILVAKPAHAQIDKVEALPEFYAEAVYYEMARDYLNNDINFGEPDTDVVYARIAKMIRMGYIREATSLFAILDADVMTDARAARTALMLKFLEQKTAEACLDIQAMSQSFSDAAWWADLKLFCDTYYAMDEGVSEESNETDPPPSFTYYLAANPILDDSMDLDTLGTLSPMEIGLLLAANRFDSSDLIARLGRWPTDQIPGLILSISQTIEGSECLIPELVYRHIIPINEARQKLDEVYADQTRPDCLPAWLNTNELTLDTGVTPKQAWQATLTHWIHNPNSETRMPVWPSNDEETGESPPPSLFYPIAVMLNEEEWDAETYIAWHEKWYAELFQARGEDPLKISTLLKSKLGDSFSKEDQKRIYEKFLTLTFYEKQAISSIGLTEYLSQTVQENNAEAAVYRVLASFGQIETNRIEPQSISALIGGLLELGRAQATNSIGLTALRAE